MVQTRSATKKKELPQAQQPEATPRTKSGPQKGTSRRTTKRGQLSMLPETNLDVLSQILSYLHPLDLLNLARLTRQFRQFLMSKSHAFIWVAARKQVPGFPDRPPELSEPEYANLAFDPHCHSCGRVAETIYWSMRRRYCSECRDEKLVTLYHCDRLPFRHMLLLEGATVSREPYVDSQQYDEFRKEYAQILPAEKDEYVARRHEIVSQIQEHAKQCRQWHGQVVAARNQELARARTERNDSIFARLETAGYGREIKYWGQQRIMDSRSDLFDSSKPLSEKDWVQVHSKLQPKLSEIRERRIEEMVLYPRRSLLLTLYNRYTQHPAPEGGAVDVLPAISDLAHFAPFGAVLNLPEDETVDETAFQPAFDQLPALARQWRKDIDARLASLVNFDAESDSALCSRKKPTQTRPRGEDTSPKDPFKLACAVFVVKLPSHDQSHVFTYPHILTELSVSYHGLYSVRLWHNQPRTLFPEGWNFITLFTGAQDVVRACGLDPRTATVEDMDQLNARLICNACRYQRIFKWKSAMFHANYTYHSSRGSNLWTLLDQNLVPMVEAEEKACDRPYQGYCALCQRRADAPKYNITTHSSSLEWLPGHLDKVHSVKVETSALQEDVHYFASWDGSTDFKPIVWNKRGGGRSSLI